jgi:hypothetical protein
MRFRIVVSPWIAERHLIPRFLLTNCDVWDDHSTNCLMELYSFFISSSIVLGTIHQMTFRNSFHSQMDNPDTSDNLDFIHHSAEIISSQSWLDALLIAYSWRDHNYELRWETDKRTIRSFGGWRKAPEWLGRNFSVTGRITAENASETILQSCIKCMSAWNGMAGAEMGNYHIPCLSRTVVFALENNVRNNC